jgi:peptidoglycan/xylan/chitin deacetylase (PgdA/CDA1 family)
MKALLNSRLITAPLGRRLRQARRDDVVVLCYHAIRPDRQPDGVMPFEGIHATASTFDAHCRVLARYCHPISLACWREARAGGRPLPERAVVLTFDDGYRSVLTDALPVLRRYGVPGAVFLVTGAIARRELFWYDALARADGEAAVERAKRLPYDLWKRETEPRRRFADRSDPSAPLDARDVVELARDPLIEIGGHTENHPILAKAPPEIQAAEVAACSRAIAAWTGRFPRAFAYPNGQPGLDLTDETRAVVATAGFDTAFTTEERPAAPDDDPLLLPRMTVTSGMTAAHLLRRLQDLWA